MVEQKLYDAVIIIPLPNLINMPLFERKWDNNCSSCGPCRQIQSVLESIEMTYRHLQEQLDKITLDMRMIFPAPATAKKARRTRGLFYFLGEASKYLIGTATSSDVRALANKIAQLHFKLEKSNLEYVQIADDVACLANVSSAAINRLALQVQVQMSKVRQATILSAASIDQVHNMSAENQLHVDFLEKVQIFVTTYHLQFRSVDNYINGLRAFITAVERANIGQLSTDLVSPTELDATLAQVRSLAGKKGLLLVHQNLDFYYTHSMSALFYTKDHLYVHLKVPVSRQVAWYDLHQVHTFGLPAQSKDFPAFTKINTEVKLLAVSRDNNYFIEITGSDRDNCKGEEFVQCTVVPNRLPTHQPTCMYAIFDNQIERAKAQCSHTAFPNREVPTYVRRLGGSEVIMTAG